MCSIHVRMMKFDVDIDFHSNLMIVVFVLYDHFGFVAEIESDYFVTADQIVVVVAVRLYNKNRKTIDLNNSIHF